MNQKQQEIKQVINQIYAEVKMIEFQINCNNQGGDLNEILEVITLVRNKMASLNLSLHPLVSEQDFELDDAYLQKFHLTGTE